MQVAQLVPADLGDVISFWRTIEGVGLNESDTPEYLEIFLKRNPGLSLIIRDGMHVAGAVLCGQDGRRGYLHHLAIAPQYRNQGLGTLLVEHCLSQLRSLGILKCNIFVYHDNDPGTLFWRKTGWQDRSDLKIMQKGTASSPQLPQDAEPFP